MVIVVAKKEKKEIIQLSLNGEFIKEWESARDITDETGIPYKSISSVCKGNKKTTHGFRWYFKDYYKKNKDEIEKDCKGTVVTGISKIVLKLTVDGQLIEKFNSTIEASKSVLGSNSSISRTCRGEQELYKGFKWIYEEDYEKYT